MRTRSIGFLASLLLGTAIGGGNAHAAIWSVDAAGNWTTNSNWDTNDDPNGPAAVAELIHNITTGRTVTLNAPITLGTLTAGDPTGPYSNYTLAANNVNNTLTFDVAGDFVNSASLNKNVSGGGNLVINSTMTLRLNDPLVINWLDPSTNGGDLRLQGTINSTVANSALGVTIKGNGTGSIVDGTDAIAKVRFEGAGAGYTYAGDTTLQGAYVSVRDGVKLPFGAEKGNINVWNDGAKLSALELQWGGGTNRINGLNGDGFVTHSGNPDGTAPANNLITLQVGNNDASGAFSGSIRIRSSLTPPPSGSRILNFEKTGAGTQTLSGADTYNGTTTVNGGTLLVNGTHTGGGAYSVATGTLGGNGNITLATDQSVVVSATGKLSPGAATPDLTFTFAGNGGLDLSAVTTGSLLFDLDTEAASDQVVITAGSLTIADLEFGDFAFTPSGNFGPGEYVLFATGGAINGNLGGLVSGSINGFDASLSKMDGQGIVLTVVPEPNAMLLAGIGLLGLGWSVRRKRK